MRNLRGINGDLMKPQQQCKALQSRILPYDFQDRPATTSGRPFPYYTFVSRKQKEISSKLWRNFCKFYRSWA